MSMREYLIPQKKVIAGTKEEAINFKDTLATTRQCVKDITTIIDDNESLALLSIIDDKLDRGEKEISTIIKSMEKMEADIDAASEINFMLISTIVSMRINNLNAVIENTLAVLNTLNAIKVHPVQ